MKRSEQSYQHTAELVIQAESLKILWDMNIQMEHVIEHRRPDMVVVGWLGGLVATAFDLRLNVVVGGRERWCEPLVVQN